MFMGGTHLVARHCIKPLHCVVFGQNFNVMEETVTFVALADEAAITSCGIALGYVAYCITLPCIAFSDAMQIFKVF